MKKIVTILKISVGLIFISNTSDAQESSNKIQEIPSAITQKRTEPAYKIPEPKSTDANVKPDLSLQAKPVAQQNSGTTNTQKDDEIMQPVALPKNLNPTTSASTIDTKMNTDKYYHQKPLLHVEQPAQVSKQIVKEKSEPQQVAVVVQ